MGHRRARHFYPRSPCGERPAIGRRDRAGRDISIHALLAESDLLGRDDDMTQLEFLSTLSLRRATGCRCPPRHWHGGFLSTLSLRRATIEEVSKYVVKDYFYPRSPCGERPRCIVRPVPGPQISIHALLAESDPQPGGTGLSADHFYPRSPCGERPAGSAHDAARLAHFYPRSPCGERRPMTYEETIEWIFLSTLSLRRATGDAFYLDLVSGISIHALLAESDVFCQCKKRVGSCISIHALLAESDNHATLDAGGNDLFLSTLSLRRATVGQIACGEPITAISIHALLAESDYSMGRNEKSFRGYFYPRSPCGERLRGWTLNINGPIFLSTLSLRRATKPGYLLAACHGYFYPRSPCGERPHNYSEVRTVYGISIHALLAESDFGAQLDVVIEQISIHALLAESDRR